MNRKLTFFLIALVGIGLYALPSTTALFAGQHSFVNIDATGNQIECVKCHGDVKAELGGQGSLVTGTDGPHANFECAYCHRVEAGMSSGDNAFALIAYRGDVAERSLAITLQDLEEMNYPQTITADQIEITGLKGKYALTDVESGLNDSTNLTVLTKREDGRTRVLSTYTDGAPSDNLSTSANGLDLSKVTSWYTTPGSHGYLRPNLDGAGSEAVNPGSSYHAASLVSCMECHGGTDHGALGHYSRVLDDEDDTSCGICHYGTSRWNELDAGGFGLTVLNPDDTGAAEAHNEFVKADDGLTRYGGSSLTNDTALYASNGACVACHTHVKVDITYTKPDTLAFEVDMTGTNSIEVLTNFSANGEAVSHSSGV